MDNKKTVVIIGAGPAGLTAAQELLKDSNVQTIIFEQDPEYVGGISRTVNYKGNRIDIGGHRFFSKSETVMNWWKEVLPVEDEKHSADAIDKVFLTRSRLSRILFEGNFYDYPISLNKTTITNLGLVRIIKIGVSYLKARVFPIKDEKSLKDFLINRFGNELYLTFFKDYTEKVWGVPCEEISSEWGAQRIKGLSVTKALVHAVKSLFQKDDSLSQKKTETSLIQRFLYPKLGPGQLWEVVAKNVQEKGVKLHMNHKVTKVNFNDDKIVSVTVVDRTTAEEKEISADHVISTMPVRKLVAAMGDRVPEKVQDVASRLQYRDFITVGLLLKKLAIKNREGSDIADNWIYIQEKNVKLGRLQIFNNWSPYLVKEKDAVWMGLEYFCNKGDSLWSKGDDEFKQIAIAELERIHVIQKDDVLDSTIIRVPKAYPSYFGAYTEFDTVREFTDGITNLFLIGRNGMHKYNNQDHSMLTAIAAAKNIMEGKTTKENIWQVNAEKEYHEEKK